MLTKKRTFSIMNAGTFASLLLIFSTTVLATSPETPGNSTDKLTPGAYKDVDVNSKDIQTLAQQVLTQIQSVVDASFDCVYKINTVFNAEVLVPAKKTSQRKKFKLEICPKTCINDIVEPEHCRLCSVEVRHLPWINVLQLKKFKCKPNLNTNVNKPALPGHTTAATTAADI